MKDARQANDRIELRGFGVFSVKPRKTGIGRNPRTGSEVNIPPGKAVRFKPGKDLQSWCSRQCGCKCFMSSSFDSAVEFAIPARPRRFPWLNLVLCGLTCL